MNSNKTIPAVIHSTLAIGSSVSAPYYDINITQQLCGCACTDERPVFDPKFSVSSIDNVGTSQYIINIHVEGVINYIPCGCGSCSTRNQIISQDFTIPVFSATAITGATLAAGSSLNYIAKTACANCSKTFVSDTPLTVTIITT